MSSRDKSPERYEKKSNNRVDKKEHEKKDKDNRKSSRSRSRSFSRRSDRSPREKSQNKSREDTKSNKNKNENIEKNYGDILDKDMISDKYTVKKDEKSNVENSNSENKDLGSYSKPNDRSEVDYNKLRVDDIKSELKKRGISFSRYAVKSELTELLAKHEKSGENK